MVLLPKEQFLKDVTDLCVSFSRTIFQERVSADIVGKGDLSFTINFDVTNKKMEHIFWNKFLSETLSEYDRTQFSKERLLHDLEVKFQNLIQNKRMYKTILIYYFEDFYDTNKQYFELV